MGCQVTIADKIVRHEADYLLALKGNQPTLEAEVADYFRSAPAEEVVSKSRKLKKGMAASRCEPARLRPRSIGLSLKEAIRASRASPTSRRW
jgi:predicted transposase YbfD/YdcC